jgi:hypothetical protein
MTTSRTYDEVETAIGGRYVMRLSPGLVGVLLVFCSLALTAGGSGGAATTSSTSSSKLPLVDWNCYTTGRVKPTRIVLACGDGNGVAENLTWLKWSRKVAIGKGDLNQNDCMPDCAEGTFHVSGSFSPVRNSAHGRQGLLHQGDDHFHGQEPAGTEG